LTLVTKDSDFADLAALLGPPPKVTWLRCGNQPTQVIATLLRRHAQAIAAFGDDADASCLEIS
jgi:predicted nuclease of predicted toxin-antitoxin system